MPEWITQYLGVIGAAILVCAWALYKSGIVQRLWQARRFIHETEAEVTKSTQRRLETREQERNDALAKCASLEQEIAKLRNELVDCVREKDIRDEINHQDHATIRRLKALLDQHNIDYSDIDELVKKRI